LLLEKNLNLASQEWTDFIRKKMTQWQCPLTGAALVERDDLFCGPKTGIVYLKLRGVSLLRAEHAVLASWLGLWQSDL
jgi:hypothetical protein